MTMTLHYLSYATCSAKLQHHSSTNKRISPSRTPLIVIHVRIGASLIQMSTLQRQLYRGPFTLREAREAASFIFQQVRTQCSASLPVFSTQFHPTQTPPEVKPSVSATERFHWTLKTKLDGVHNEFYTAGPILIARI